MVDQYTLELGIQAAADLTEQEPQTQPDKALYILLIEMIYPEWQLYRSD